MCKVTETATTWYPDSTQWQQETLHVNGATVNCTSRSEATALALLCNPRLKDCQDMLFQESGNCKDYSNSFFTDERTGMPAKCVRALQMFIMLNKHLECMQQ